jgi:NHLM bacteriocin system ABC transporter ATP-binding protein
MGERFGERFQNDRQRVKNAVDEVLRYFRIPLVPVPETAEDLDAYLDYALRPAGVMKRRVRLSGAWHREAIGPMLGSLKSGEVIALLPLPFSGYAYIDPFTGETRRVTRARAALIDDDAFCFYRPFPPSRMSVKDLLRYMVASLSAGDLALYAGVSLLMTLFGLVTPAVNRLLFGTVIPGGHNAYLLPTLVMLVAFAIGTAMLGTTRNFLSRRITTRIQLAVEPAAMARLLLLPPTFFKPYSSGELASRLAALSNLCDQLVNAVTGTLLSALLSLIYLFQIGSFAGALVGPAMLLVLMQVLLNLLAAWAGLKHERAAMAVGAKLSGLVFALFSGIQKIKLTGSEKRSFAKWAELYRQQAKLTYAPPRMLRYASVMSMTLTLAGTLAFYVIAVQNKLSVGDYMAFSASYGMIGAALLSLTDLTATFASVKPQLEMAAPILAAEPETDEGKTVLDNVSGAIELSHVSFRYDESGPDLISDVSLKIKPHAYVAIVGRTGCGKSTLLRLMMGFETPRKGAIYYDNVDLSRIDLRSLRRRIGVVIQNGRLFAGDIYANIAISNPALTLSEAWDIARLSGLDQDIADMPMGMYTVITEGGGGLSGGQRQRLMIARALAAKPRILMLDEATSALDNITQKQVADSLAALKCTRIVVAHRLSTIRECDRIIVLEGGRIAEDGTFDELIARRGAFYELASRQLLDSAMDVGAQNVY